MSWMVELLIVAMDGDAAVVRNGAGHGGHARDDTGGRVIGQDGVWRLSVFTTAAQDIDLSITYRHTATFLLAECVDYMHPVIFSGVIAVDGFGQASRNIDEIVQWYRCDAALSNGDVGP